MGNFLIPNSGRLFGLVQFGYVVFQSDSVRFFSEDLRAFYFKLENNDSLNFWNKKKNIVSWVA